MRSKAIHRPLAVFALAFAIAACGGGDAETDASREIELTPTPADEAMGDQAAATPPTTPAASPTPARPAPARPAPAPRSGTVAAGTDLVLAAGARICTNTHAVGDRFTASLTSAVSGSNGTVIPAGTAVTLEVVESTRGENSADKMRLAFKPVSIALAGAGSVDLNAEVTQVARLETVRLQSNRTQAEKVAVGAAAGAVAGQILGRDTKSTIAGAAIGAAAGGAVAAATTDYNGCLAENGAITVKLAEALTVRR